MQQFNNVLEMVNEKLEQKLDFFFYLVLDNV
jgi:hypothetical protein